MFKSLVWLDTEKIPAQAGFEPGTVRSRSGRLTTRPPRRLSGWPRGKPPVSRAWDLGITIWSSRISDLWIYSPGASLSEVWRCRVSGWPSVGILWRDEVANLMCSLLGLVDPASSYCDGARRQVWYAASVSVRQRVKMSKHVCPWNRLYLLLRR